MNISELFFGKVRLSIKGKREWLLNLLELYSFEYRELKAVPCGIEISLKLPEYIRLKKLFKEKNIEYDVTKKGGLPYIGKSLLFRPGIIIGFLFFFISLYIYSFTVFDIKINGNDRLSDKYILDALESEGFLIGCDFRKFDLDEMSVSISAKYPDITWIFVNMMGNVAYVEMKEYKPEILPEKPKYQYSHLVAKTEGQIVSFEVSSGIIKVNIGETVYKGQKIVSGVEHTEKKDHFLQSQGKVYAKVIDRFELSVPYERSVFTEENRELIEKSLTFLGFEINLLKKGGNLGDECAIIEEVSKLTVMGGTELPVYIKEKYGILKKEVSVTLTSKEASLELEKLFSSYMEENYSDATVLGIDREIIKSDSEYKVSFTVRCIKDIALEVEAFPDEIVSDKEQE